MVNVMNDLSSIPSSINSGDRAFVYAIARRIVRTHDEAEDVTQEALLLAFRHRDSFRGDSRYRTWLYRIAVTTALGHLRKARRSREDPTPVDLRYDLADAAASPEADVAARQAAGLVDQAIAELDPKYRDVIALRADDCTESEIARRLGISVANVKIRIHRARRQLRDELDRVAA